MIQKRCETLHQSTYNVTMNPPTTHQRCTDPGCERAGLAGLLRRRRIVGALQLLYSLFELLQPQLEAGRKTAAPASAAAAAAGRLQAEERLLVEAEQCQRVGGDGQ